LNNRKKKKNSWVCCSFLFWSNLSLRWSKRLLIW
jgi:hypothetical protein